MVRNHDLTLPLPVLDIPHENLHWTFCREDQCTPHQEQKKNQKHPYKPPGENGYPMGHCYCGETHPPELDEVIRIQRLNPRKACHRWQQGRCICHQCGFLVNLTAHSLRCRNPERIPIPTNNDETQTILPDPKEPRQPYLPEDTPQTQPQQAHLTPTKFPTTLPYRQNLRSPYYSRAPTSQQYHNHRRIQKSTHLSHQRSLVGASALERGIMSRINNDMLLGAIAASAVLWMFGITVTVGYLATKGRRE
jgi:hypothetical protein